MANLAVGFKKVGVWLALSLSSTGAFAQTTQVECDFSARAGGLLEVDDRKQIRSQSAEPYVFTPSIDACNRSFSTTRGVSFDGGAAEASVSLVSNLAIIDGSYVYTSSATTSGSASLNAAPTFLSESRGISAAMSSIKVQSDGPLTYHFSASYDLSEHSPGQFQTDRLTFTATPGNEVVLGKLYPGETDVGNHYEETGTVSVGPDNLASIFIKGFSDGGYYFLQYGSRPFTPVAATDSGTTWSYRLVVSPVPEPTSQLMLLSGLLGLGFWHRKRAMRRANSNRPLTPQ